MMQKEKAEGLAALIEDELFKQMQATLIAQGHVTDTSHKREPTAAEVEHNKDLILASFNGLIRFTSLWIAANSKNGESFDKLSAYFYIALAKDLSLMRPGVYEVGEMTKEQMKTRVAELQKGKH